MLCKWHAKSETQVVQTELQKSPRVTAQQQHCTTTRTSRRILCVYGIGSETDGSSRCRHKRTHDRGDGVNSGEEEQYSGEEPAESVEDASPASENGYVAGSLNSAVQGDRNVPASAPESAPAANATTDLQQTQTFNSLQTLSMPMTISQPQPINAGGVA